MDVSEIARVAEAELVRAIGADRISRIGVSEEPGGEGVPFLSIMVQSPDERLPTARQSIAATLALEERLREGGEIRFPNVVFVTPADAV